MIVLLGFFTIGFCLDIKMAFVCPPRKESEDNTKILANLRNALAEVEKTLSVGVKPVCVPCCIPMCSLPCPPCSPCQPVSQKEQHVDKVNLPEVMVCYKICEKHTKSPEIIDDDDYVHRVKQSNSRELRASILYTGCDCDKCYGLQDDCPRTDCHGRPECLTRPPTCGPSEFCNGKHLRTNKNKLKPSKITKKSSGNGKMKAARYQCFPAVTQSPVCCIPCELN